MSIQYVIHLQCRAFTDYDVGCLFSPFKNHDEWKAHFEWSGGGTGVDGKPLSGDTWWWVFHFILTLVLKSAISILMFGSAIQVSLRLPDEREHLVDKLR